MNLNSIAEYFDEAGITALLLTPQGSVQFMQNYPHCYTIASRDYLNCPDKTAEAYEDCPFSKYKMYHTGDIVRYRQDDKNIMLKSNSIDYKICREEENMKEFEKNHPYFWLILGLILTIFSYGIFNTGICAWIFAIPLIRYINIRTKISSIIFIIKSQEHSRFSWSVSHKLEMNCAKLS